MFVQIGDWGINPDHIAGVYFGTAGGYERPEEPFAEVYVTSDALTSGREGIICFENEDYHAFMDWWTRCANVSKFPNGNGKTQAD